MWQKRFWSPRRKFDKPAQRDLRMNPPSYEPVILEEHVVKEIMQRLWLSGVPIFRERERIHTCPHCHHFIAAPSDPGHPDLHGYVPSHLLGKKKAQAVPVYIEAKRPEGGVRSAVQEQFISDALSRGCIAGFATCWDEVNKLFVERGIKLRAA
jgi:hypothetical protein